MNNSEEHPPPGELFFLGGELSAGFAAIETNR